MKPVTITPLTPQELQDSLSSLKKSPESVGAVYQAFFTAANMALRAPELTSETQYTNIYQLIQPLIEGGLLDAKHRDAHNNTALHLLIQLCPGNKTYMRLITDVAWKQPELLRVAGENGRTPADLAPLSTRMLLGAMRKSLDIVSPVLAAKHR